MFCWRPGALLCENRLKPTASGARAGGPPANDWAEVTGGLPPVLGLGAGFVWIGAVIGALGLGAKD